MTPGKVESGRRLVHVTTTDMSLALLLGPQLAAYRDAGFEVIGASAPGPFVRRLTDIGIEHVALEHTTRAISPRHDIAAFGELHRLFRRLRPLVVHTHNPKPGVYGRIAARAARVPVVVNTVHGLYATADDRRMKRALVYGLERAAAVCSDAELVQNPEDLEQLRRLRIPARKLHLLGNGIDLERFDPDRFDGASVEATRASLGVGPGEVLCGVVGRLVWEKGYREVFDAARMLRDRSAGVRVVVIGPADSDKADAISDADVARARHESGVVFAGERDDVESLYAAMDLYVLASHREGFPRSAMEAAAMRVPVIATDIRGCRQVVEPDVTGRLVPVRDATALAEAIATLAADGDGRRLMGDAGRMKARREFDEQTVIDTTLAVYDDLVRRKASRGDA